MVEKTFSTKNVSNKIRNQIITVIFFWGWKNSLYWLSKKLRDRFLKNPTKSRKGLTVTYVKEVLTYILRNLLNKLENCIELLIDRI